MIIKFSKRSLEKSKQYVSTCTCKETLWLQNSANYTEKEQKYKKKIRKAYNCSHSMDTGASDMYC